MSDPGSGGGNGSGLVVSGALIMLADEEIVLVRESVGLIPRRASEVHARVLVGGARVLLARMTRTDVFNTNLASSEITDLERAIALLLFAAERSARKR